MACVSCCSCKGTDRARLRVGLDHPLASLGFSGLRKRREDGMSQSELRRQVQGSVGLWREMGWRRRCAGTHILKDFELQRSGIQIIEFPCKGKTQIREDSALPGVCVQAPPLPLLRLHKTSQKRHVFSKCHLGSAFWYTSPPRSCLL